MKHYVYHGIIAFGILAFGFLFWHWFNPTRHDVLSVDELRHMFRRGATPHERAQGAAGLGERRDVASMPELLDAMESDSPEVRGHASVAVRKILGADYDFDPQATPNARHAVVARYRSLWEAWQLKHQGMAEPSPIGIAGTGGDS